MSGINIFQMAGAALPVIIFGLCFGVCFSLGMKLFNFISKNGKNKKETSGE